MNKYKFYYRRRPCNGRPDKKYKYLFFINQCSIMLVLNMWIFEIYRNPLPRNKKLNIISFLYNVSQYIKNSKLYKTNRGLPF